MTSELPKWTEQEKMFAKFFSKRRTFYGRLTEPDYFPNSGSNNFCIPMDQYLEFRQKLIQDRLRQGY